MDKHIVEFNTYLHDANVDSWAELCRKYGTLRSYKRGDEFITAGQTACYIGLIKEAAGKYVVYTPESEERILSELAGFANKADDMDNMMVERFGCEFSAYTKQND